MNKLIDLHFLLWGALAVCILFEDGIELNLIQLSLLVVSILFFIKFFIGRILIRGENGSYRIGNNSEFVEVKKIERKGSRLICLLADDREMYIDCSFCTTGQITRFIDRFNTQQTESRLS